MAFYSLYGGVSLLMATKPLASLGAFTGASSEAGFDSRSWRFHVCGGYRRRGHMPERWWTHGWALLLTLLIFVNCKVRSYIARDLTAVLRAVENSATAFG